MDILLSILAIIFALVGCVGCIVPIIPGVALAYVGYLCLYFCSWAEISVAWLVVFGVLTLFATLLDYLLPSYMTKKFGGSKAGERGAMIGALVGIFAGPIGVIVAPFIGAVIGELLHDNSNRDRALKSGVGSFLSFFVGTGIKLVISLWMVIEIFIDVFKHIF